MFIKNKVAFKDAVPDNGVCCVYLLICDKLGVIYVGQTTGLAGRISGHTSSGKIFDRFEYMVCDPNEANEIECREMIKYNPPLNTSLPLTDKHIALGPLKKLLVQELTAKIDSIIFSLPRTFDRGAEKRTNYKYVDSKIIPLLKNEINKLSLPKASK